MLNEPELSLFNPSLNVVLICLIPFLCRNSENSPLVNAAALCETTTSGSPRDANDFRNSSIVVVDVDELVM